jgi:transposase
MTEVKQVFTRGPRARCSHGAGAPRRVPLAVGAIESIAPKIGCVPRPSTNGSSVTRSIRVREGITTSELQRLKELEREVKELRKANEILKLASAFFAQAELDRRLKS